MSVVSRFLFENGSLKFLAFGSGVAKPVIPPGVVESYAGATAPEGWLICDGSAVSRTTYKELFDVLGTTYGAGDGSTTFELPDCRGEFVRGLDGGRGVDSGRTLGSAQGFQLGQHNHPTGNLSVGNHTHPSGNLNTGNSNAPHSHPGNSGGVNLNHPHNLGPGPQGVLSYPTGAFNNIRLNAQDTPNGPRHYAPVGPSNQEPETRSSNINHSHPVSVGTDNAPHSHNVGGSTGNSTAPVAGVIGDTGATPNSSEIRPRNVAMNFIIKV